MVATQEQKHYVVGLCDLMARMWDEHGLHPNDCPDEWRKAGFDIPEGGLTADEFRQILDTYYKRRGIKKEFGIHS